MYRLDDWEEAMDRVRQGYVATPVDLRSSDHLPSALVVDRAQELLAFLCAPAHNEDPEWEHSWSAILGWVRSVSFKVLGVDELQLHYVRTGRSDASAGAGCPGQQEAGRAGAVCVYHGSV